MVEPFVYGKAMYNGKTWNQLKTEEDKINALEALYDEGREIGVAKFKADPRYQKYISSEDELEAVKEQKDKIRGNKESLIESVKQTRKWQGNQKK